MGFISCHITPLVVNSLGGRDTCKRTHTRMHTSTHAHKHTHTHAHTHVPHGINFKKPEGRHAPGLEIMVWLHETSSLSGRLIVVVRQWVSEMNQVSF